MYYLTFIRNFIMLCILISPLQGFGGNFCSKSYNRDIDRSCEVNESDFYMGASMGRIVPTAKVFNFNSSNAPGSALGLFWGRRLSERMGFEVGYLQAGSFFDPSSGNTTDVNIYSFSAIGRYPLGNKNFMSLYARLGWGISYVTIIDIGNNWHGDLTYGGGIEFALGSSRDWHLRVGLDEYNTGSLSPLVPGQPVPRDKLDNISAAIMFNF